MNVFSITIIIFNFTCTKPLRRNKAIREKRIALVEKKKYIIYRLKSNNQRQSSDNIPEEVNEFSKLRVQLSVQRPVAFIYANNKSVDAVNYNGNEPNM